MPTLYTYCIPFDDGAAPNPYSGILTLNICKPVIRRVAKIGDWVVGTGAKLSETNDYRGYVVYAMRVTDKMSMEAYDIFAQEHFPNKIPNWKSTRYRDKVGDSIYDFSTKPPSVRKSVHTEKNRPKDLRGEYTLLSDYFFYFGNKPIELPEELKPIVKSGQAHKSTSNNKYFEPFLVWLHSLKLKPNKLYGKPQIDIVKNEYNISCSDARLKEAKQDEKLGNCK